MAVATAAVIFVWVVPDTHSYIPDNVFQILPHEKSKVVLDWDFLEGR
jgi:hypothetical protein